MLFPPPFSMISYDHAPQIQVGHASVEWVLASLRRHPMTMHLHQVRVREEGEAVVLEGEVPTRLDREWAGMVAQRAMGEGELNNRLLVLEDQGGPSWEPPRSEEEVAYPNLIVTHEFAMAA